MAEVTETDIQLLRQGIALTEQATAAAREASAKAPVPFWPGVLLVGKAELQQLLADSQSGRVNREQIKQRLRTMIAEREQQRAAREAAQQ